jgi:hypothetical protein
MRRRGYVGDLGLEETELFLKTGLDGPNQPDPFSEFRFSQRLGNAGYQ